jgi:P-type Cu+ transporter
MSATRVTVEIFGLSCGGALILERSLQHVPGVGQVYVNPATEMAYVEYDPSVCDAPDLVHAIEKTGFGAGQPHRR